MGPDSTLAANAGAALDQPGAGDALDRMDRMYALHVRAVATLAELALPVIADGGGGAFLIMSSLSGLRGNRVLSGYGVTKAARPNSRATSPFNGVAAAFVRTRSLRA